MARGRTPEGSGRGRQNRSEEQRPIVQKSEEDGDRLVVRRNNPWSPTTTTFRERPSRRQQRENELKELLRRRSILVQSTHPDAWRDINDIDGRIQELSRELAKPQERFY